MSKTSVLHGWPLLPTPGVALSGVLSISLAVICVAAPGCRRHSRPETIPVQGTVTLDGKPVEGASVAFYPKSSGNPAMGRTDSSGRFVLSTYVDKDGAVPGEHTVVISKVARRGPVVRQGVGEEQFSPPTTAESEKAATEYLIPEKYSMASESGLSAVVTRGCGPITFDLKSNY